MYVEEVCIDGFKSYAQRTVVPAFDPLFNAITGLNGSGKSNILDSICFVLGITNLSQVRRDATHRRAGVGAWASALTTPRASCPEKIFRSPSAPCAERFCVPPPTGSPPSCALNRSSRAYRRRG